MYVGFVVKIKEYIFFKLFGFISIYIKKMTYL